jgi:hypothetical protein
LQGFKDKSVLACNFICRLFKIRSLHQGVGRFFLADYVAMVHSDGQYAPEYLPILFKALEDQKAEMVFGSRIAGEPLKGSVNFIV